MEKRSIQVQFFTLLVCLLMAFPAAQAPSHPVFIDPETGETIDTILGNPGTTPDSIWYGFERWWEDIQVANTNTPEERTTLLQSLMQERYAEFHAMIEEGNYDVAKYTIGEIEQIENKLVGIIDEVEATGENLYFIHDVEQATLKQENIREMLEQNMKNLVAAGEMTPEQAESLATAMEEEITNVQAAVESQEEDITNAIAQEQGISHFDAQLQVESQENNRGLGEQYQQEVQEKLDNTQDQLEQIQQEFKEVIAAGQEVPPATLELLSQAQARIDLSRQTFYEERYSQSYDEFVGAKYLLDTAENFLDHEITASELGETVDAVQERQRENNQEYLDEYEENLDRWIEEHPQYADSFDSWAQQSRNELALYLVVGEESFQQLQTQLREEGKTDEEVFETLTQYYRDEYEHAFGVPYVPPVFEVVDEGSYYDPDAFNKNKDNEKKSFDEMSTKGGFVEGYSYKDQATGYVYEFTQDGYTYTTPLGLKYEEKFPDDFSFPTAYEQGNEQHSYTKETPKGTVTYNYYATGYDVTLADGTTQTYAYPPGSYDLPEGGLFNYHPTGYEFRHDESAVWYDYNVVYDTFIGEDGEVSRPPEGTYFQEDIGYSYDEQRYEFADPNGILWAYNPESHAWSSSDGQVYTPDATVIAPVGHEGEGNYQTELGETWTWDDSTNTWESNGGDMFHPESNTWQPSETTANVNERYTFDPATGQYLDEETGEPSTNVVWSGVTWVYDNTANSWTSNTGETYDGGLHQVPSTRNLEAGIAPYDSSKVYDFDPVLGKFIDPDTNQVADIAWSGVTWNRDAETGEWSSDTGETRSADWTGDYNQDTSTEQSSQSWTYEPNTGTWASPGWSYDSGSGVWSSPEGEAFHDPDGNPNAWQDDSGGWHNFDESVDGATYQGTPYDGGSYSGDGGSMGSDDGSSGDGGNGGDGGAGAVANSYTAKELHSLTKWVYKYLGIKN